MDIRRTSISRRFRPSPPQAALGARWAWAQRRLAAALEEDRALAVHARVSDPARVATQLRVAEARRRCAELAEELAEDLGAGSGAAEL
jgi:hypothetical protein